MRIVRGGNRLLNEILFLVITDSAVFAAVVSLPEALSSSQLLFVGLRFAFLKIKRKLINKNANKIFK